MKRQPWSRGDENLRVHWIGFLLEGRWLVVSNVTSGHVPVDWRRNWLMQEFDFNHCVLRGHFQTLLPSRLPGSAFGQRGSVIAPVWPLCGMWGSHLALWSAGPGHTPCIWPHGLFVTFPLGVNAINGLLGTKSLPSCFRLVLQIHSCLPSGSLTVTT